MTKITDIQIQNKNPNRVNIFLDGQFAFGLSATIRFDERIEIGQEISDKKIGELIEKDQVERLVNKSLRFLSFRPRSEKELRDHLLRAGKLKEIESEVEKAGYNQSAEKVITELKKLGQVDDGGFASWWVEQRLKFKPMAMALIKRELLAKGVDKETIAEAIKVTEGVEGTNEEELAKKAALKKLSSYKKLDSETFRIKMGQFLARKGFSWEIIKKVVDSFVEKRVE